jgi:hypothetical protein
MTFPALRTGKIRIITDNNFDRVIVFLIYNFDKIFFVIIVAILPLFKKKLILY